MTRPQSLALSRLRQENLEATEWDAEKTNQTGPACYFQFELSRVLATLYIYRGRRRMRLALNDFHRAQLRPQVMFSPTSLLLILGSSVPLSHFPSAFPLSQETRSEPLQWSVNLDFPISELLRQALLQCLRHLLWPYSRQGSPAAFCLGNSICLCLFCRQYFYRAQTRPTHCLFKEKVRSSHKRMFCVDSEGEQQFMTCVCFCHYVWLFHFIVELIIPIIAFPCTYNREIGGWLLVSIRFYCV